MQLAQTLTSKKCTKNFPTDAVTVPSPSKTATTAESRLTRPLSQYQVLQPLQCIVSDFDKDWLQTLISSDILNQPSPLLRTSQHLTIGGQQEI